RPPHAFPTRRSSDLFHPGPAELLGLRDPGRLLVVDHLLPEGRLDLGVEALRLPCVPLGSRRLHRFVFQAEDLDLSLNSLAHSALDRKSTRLNSSHEW